MGRWLAVAALTFCEWTSAGETPALRAMIFENRGQAKSDVRYILDSHRLQAYFINNKITLRSGGSDLNITFPGANASVEPVGLPEKSGHLNYLVGSDPSHWAQDLPLYSGVVYRNLYHGIDMRWRIQDNIIKSEFVVSAGADPALIHLHYSGMNAIRIDETGALEITTAEGKIRDHAPTAYSVLGATRKSVDIRYHVRSDGDVTFEAAAYDNATTLVIDPTLSYSTLLGGGAHDTANSVAIDSYGNSYVAGWTESPDFPATGGLHRGNGIDAFVAKFTSSNSLAWCTYFGGQGADRANGITVDSSGNVIVVGDTSSSDLPVSRAIQTTLHGSQDAFVAKLNAAGNALIFATYFGGSGTDSAVGVSLDPAGNIYVAGNTASSDFPTLYAYQPNRPGQQDAFVFKLDATGSTLFYSTYLGGLNTDTAAAIAVDSGGNAYVAGGTQSGNFPVASAFRSTFPLPGQQAAFLTKLNTDGRTLAYSTFLGGTAGGMMTPETATGVAVDSAGEACVTGVTSSSDFPVLRAYQGSAVWGTHGFVTKFNAAGNGLVFSTYLGGSGRDWPMGIAVNSSGVFVGGYTSSTDFPLQNAIQQSNAGMYDAFAAGFDANGSLVFSTYLGGGGTDSANAIAADVSGNIVLAGNTMSSNFPLQNPMQSSDADGYSAFLAKIATSSAGGPTYSLLPASVNVSASAGTGTTSLTVSPATAAWTATSGVSWLAITSAASGTGNATIAYSVAANNSANQRASFLTVGGATFNVTQAGVTPTFSLNPTFTNATSAGSTGTVAVTANPQDATWTAASNNAWITITSGASGTGNGNAGYSIASNSSSNPRSGTLTIAGQTFSVTQSGAAASFTLNPPSATAGSSGGNATVSVTATPSDATWTAASNSAWITILSGASGTGNGTVGYTVASNASTNSRSGSLSIAGIAFNVTQSGLNPSVTLNPTSTNIVSTGGTGTVSVTATPSDASWTATSNTAWITITSGSSGTGNGSVGYSVAATNSVNARLGTLTIGGQVFSITEAGATPSISLNPTSTTVGSSAATGTVSVTATPADATWTATSNNTSWLSITSGASGVGNGTVGYAGTPNNSSSQRSGSLTIGGRTFTVSQAGTGTSVSLNPTSANFNPNGGTGSTAITITPPDASWTASSNASWLAITSALSGTGNSAVNYSVAVNTLTSGRSGVLTISGQAYTVTQAGSTPTFSLNPTSANVAAGGSTGSVAVTCSASDAAWTASSNAPWVTITSMATGQGSGTVSYSIAANSGASRSGNITIAGQTFTISQAGTTTSTQGLAFYPLAPCRLVDTRGNGQTGGFGPPNLAAAATRDFPLLYSLCGVPPVAQAYSLNVTAVPRGPLAYISIWPAGQSQPVVSTLNANDGSVVANAAIVPAGTNGAISVYASNATDLVIDINGYFAGATAQGLAFYPITPCRAVDTRNSSMPNGLGTPSMLARASRSFPLESSTCGLASTAQAYSVNATVVPAGPLTYLTVWPSGLSLPTVSTLNSPSGSVVANAAIVPAGDAGAISAFASDATNLIVDANGYFGSSGGTGALYFYPVTPCRVADTRNGPAPFGAPTPTGGATRDFPIPNSSCAIPASAQAYSLNITVVPAAGLGFLTTWPTGKSQPGVSTLNSARGLVVANAAIVPAGNNGSISVYVTDKTDVIIDINGYFAP
ncbi:MAG TPA: SBBP repeat-containing protein [Bryobacteraceae bacterium]|nr:SBBP repeat-containing protein [Bryobacteraceae bacterium]